MPPAPLGLTEPPAPVRDNVVRAASIAILVVAAFGVAVWAKPVLMPLALAVLLSFALAPLVQALKRLRLPAHLGALIVVGSGVAGIATSVLQLAAPAQEWLLRLPTALRRLEEHVRGVLEPMRRIAKASESVQKIGSDEANNALQVSVLDQGTSSMLIAQTGAVIGVIAMTALLLYFLLASDGVFLRKVVHVLPTLRDKRRAVETARELEHEVSRYFSGFFAISVGLGVAEGTAMAIIGMPNPVLWGLMAMVLCWIPYAGALIGTSIVALVASVAFTETWSVLLPPLCYFSLTVVEGSFVTPLIMGRRLTLNPVIGLVWVVLWGWMWGVVGAFIAFPMLAALRIVAVKSQSLATLGELLSAGDSASSDAPTTTARSDALANSEQA